MVVTQAPAGIKGHLRIHSLLARQCLAEFLGVFVLMLLTQGAVAQAVTSGETKGNFFTMFLAGSLAVVIAIYVGGNVSGEEGGVWSSEQVGRACERVCLVMVETQILL
ncbi:aquaporin-10-like [Macaca mulatta]